MVDDFLGKPERSDQVHPEGLADGSLLDSEGERRSLGAINSLHI